MSTLGIIAIAVGCVIAAPFVLTFIGLIAAILIVIFD